MLQEVMSTATAAKLCGISTTTMNRCFDKGWIKGYRMPGSNHRRVTRNGLYKFMQTHCPILIKDGQFKDEAV